MQGGAPSDNVLVEASHRISSALACAGRHTGPCTTSISLSTMSVQQSLTDLQDHPRALTGPSMRANVVCLELLLYSQNIDEIANDVDIRHFTIKLLQRLPNLTAARLQYHCYSEVPYVPLLQLKHLDLELVGSDSLMRLPFAALMPALETARITFVVGLGRIAELDVLGCRHLTRLVLSNAAVHQLSKAPQCWLQIDMLRWNAHDVQPSQLQQSLSEVNEILLYSKEFCSPRGLLAHVCLPKLEVIRCNWDEDDNEDSSIVTNAIELCSGHTKDLPALKSILCEDFDKPADSVMEVRIPARLAGVEELEFASDRPLRLIFDCPRSAGEKLDKFCVIGREVKADAAALVTMNDALFRRGFTLSTAHAEQQHDDDAPSQCMYIRAISALQLSYDDAIDAVYSRMSRWGGYHGCADCGACFDCLREAGILDDR